MEDHELLKRTAQGDLKAFDTLVRRYQEKMLRFCYRYLHDVQAAEDATQEVFLKVYRYAGQFEPRASFSSFIYRVATNLCLDALKQRRRQAKGMPTMSFSASVGPYGDVKSMEEIIPSEAAQPEDELIREEERAAFLEALQELPENHQRALMLYELDNLSYKEISEVLGATLPEVKIWIYRARRKLATIISRAEKRNEPA
jgi:RNA polymerase sigma-70 factor (ECF subfamily)